ncbi:MAG: ABC transporter ATP-binding protein [Propionibacteriaceae bacterium]
MSALIEATELTRHIGDVKALRGVTLSVAEGEYLAVTGSSGSGKSTLLSILGLMDRPTSGTYLLDGIDTIELSHQQRTQLRAETIGFIFQEFHLLPQRSVLDNVAMGMLYLNPDRAEREKAACKALKRVGLADRIWDDPAVLSGGERQRVAIARAIAAQRRLLLCDEPTGNLDTENSQRILEILDGLHEDGLSILIVTHDPIVANHAHRRVTIEDGILSQDSTWE